MELLLSWCETSEAAYFTPLPAASKYSSAGGGGGDCES